MAAMEAEARDMVPMQAGPSIICTWVTFFLEILCQTKFKKRCTEERESLIPG